MTRCYERERWCGAKAIQQGSGVLFEHGVNRCKRLFARRTGAADAGVGCPGTGHAAGRPRGRALLWRGRITLETGVIRSPRKIVVTMQNLVENRTQWIEGVSGRALGPGLAFLDALGAGHTGFAAIPRTPLAFDGRGVALGVCVRARNRARYATWAPLGGRVPARVG